MELLASILKHTQITHIDLRYNDIGNEGVRILANGLKGSQVTHIDLSENGITQEGYQHLKKVIDYTNVCMVDLDFKINSAIKRNFTATPAYKLCAAFDKLVSLNLFTQEFEFIYPDKCFHSNFSLEEYGIFIKSIDDHPKTKVHIINFVCDKITTNFYDIKKMHKINNFLSNIHEKFNMLFNNFVLHNPKYDYMILVKKFVDLQLLDIVQNFLLHRELYFIDESKEILHPYIYILLHKFRMPLYCEKLEPNKKELLISYFKIHSKMDSALELLDVLACL